MTRTGTFFDVRTYLGGNGAQVALTWEELDPHRLGLLGRAIDAAGFPELAEVVPEPVSSLSPQTRDLFFDLLVQRVCLDQGKADEISDFMSTSDPELAEDFRRACGLVRAAMIELLGDGDGWVAPHVPQSTVLCSVSTKPSTVDGLLVFAVQARDLRGMAAHDQEKVQALGGLNLSINGLGGRRHQDAMVRLTDLANRVRTSAGDPPASTNGWQRAHELVLAALARYRAGLRKQGESRGGEPEIAVKVLAGTGIPVFEVKAGEPASGAHSALRGAIREYGKIARLLVEPPDSVDGFARVARELIRRWIAVKEASKPFAHLAEPIAESKRMLDELVSPVPHRVPSTATTTLAPGEPVSTAARNELALDGLTWRASRWRLRSRPPAEFEIRAEYGSLDRSATAHVTSFEAKGAPPLGFRVTHRGLLRADGPLVHHLDAEVTVGTKAAGVLRVRGDGVVEASGEVLNQLRHNNVDVRPLTAHPAGGA